MTVKKTMLRNRPDWGWNLIPGDDLMSEPVHIGRSIACFSNPGVYRPKSPPRRPDWTHEFREGEWTDVEAEGREKPQEVDPATDNRADPATLFNVQVPKAILQAVWDSRCEVKAADLSAAWRASIWKNAQLVIEDAKLMTASHEKFSRALPHLGTARVAYRRPYFVCRNYATAFCAIVDAVLGIGTVAKVYDWSGRHSYNVVALREDDGSLTVHGVEPQSDEFIEQLAPKKHYTGDKYCVAYLGG